jgi:succinate dehydrogenase/fumarate reductase flavoprotein subunit
VTGDGYAMGYRAGAELMNIEFKQVFVGIVYPTRNTIYLWAWDRAPTFLNAQGQEFLDQYCPPGVTPEQILAQHSLHDPASTRDPYSRYLEVAIMGEVIAGRGTPRGGIWLDHRGAEHLLDPNMAAWYHYRGVFSDEELIEISVCHHCSNGGFRVDRNAQTTVPGLYAVGECLTGPHGADRRGGHMLGATQVFGARAGRHAGDRARRGMVPEVDADRVQAATAEIDAVKGSGGSRAPGALRKALQARNWQDLLWGRSEEGLGRVLAGVEQIREAFTSDLRVDSPRDLVEALELGNMLTVTEMIARVALMRQETRGSHYRLDFPERNDRDWLKSITVKQMDGRMHLDTLVLDPDWQDRAAEVAGFRWG